MTSKQKQLGFDLIQFALVLILAGLFAAAAYRAFLSNRLSSQVRGITDDLQLVAARITSMVPAGTNFAAMGSSVTAANCAVAITNQAFANTGFLVTAGTAPTVNHTLNSGAVACGATQLVASNDAFRIELQGLTNQACAELARTAEGSARRVQVNTTVVKALNGSFDASAAGTACTATGTSNAQAVSFDYSRS